MAPASKLAPPTWRWTLLGERDARFGQTHPLLLSLVAGDRVANSVARARTRSDGEKTVRTRISSSEGDLSAYRAKRDFSVTPEPAGGAPSAEVERRFVVQRHRARRLHYDFRLEVDGVLTSWAMPKGPSLDPSVRSLAVRVEDHPIEYVDFEGVIPARQYGGGDVVVWDCGTWEPSHGEDPASAIAHGEIHFDLRGEKLRGRFVLVRTRSERGRDQWLMLHKKDEFAQEGWTPEDHPRSVKSGMTNEEVAESPSALWRSDLPAEEAEVELRGASEVEPKKNGSAKAGSSTDRPDLVGKRSATCAAPTASELRALEAMGDEGVWQIDGRELKLTNLNKVLFPGHDKAKPVTKRDLVRYYTSIGPTILPYLVDRPMNMHRFPNGVDHPGFWHKEVPKHAPEWLVRWRHAEARPGETEHYAVVDSVPALAWMANFAAVELHPWTSTVANVHEPTWALIDIDPGSRTTFEDVVLLAQLFRTGLDHMGVFGLPKLTGRRGIHIWIPIERRYSFDETRTWVGQLSRAVGEVVPELVSWTWEKRGRRGLARLDFTQNAINKTLVAPYSPRASAGAPVSVPIEWDELSDPKLRSDAFSIWDVLRRVSKRGDPFARLFGREQSLPKL